MDESGWETPVGLMTEELDEGTEEEGAGGNRLVTGM